MKRSISRERWDFALASGREGSRVAIAFLSQRMAEDWVVEKGREWSLR